MASYSIVGGNPARELRRRFTETQIEALPEICRWNWEIEKITRNIALLTGNDVEALLKTS